VPSSSLLHYSFDLWLTIIKSNPNFKKLRAQYLFEHYNFKKKTIQEIEQIIRNVDVWANKTNEVTGKNIDSDELYSLVLSLVNNGELHFSQVELTSIIQELENLLFENLPMVYSDEIIPTLTQIKSKENTSTSLLSNTGFIPSHVLCIVLEKLNLTPFFDFQMYSDEYNMSKPNLDFFKMMHQKVNNLRKSEIDKSEIIHVGDNPIADIKGAKEYGIQSLLVHSNNISIKQLLS